MKRLSGWEGDYSPPTFSAAPAPLMADRLTKAPAPSPSVPRRPGLSSPDLTGIPGPHEVLPMATFMPPTHTKV